MIRVFLAALGVLIASTIFTASPASAAEPVYFFCHALNPSEGVVYVSDVHRVGPFAERSGYGERYAQWLRASGRLGEGKGRCLMRATMGEIERDRRDLPVSGCFDCVGPMVYRDVKWPFGDAPVESVQVAEVEPSRRLMSQEEEASLDRRENPATRPGTSIFGRLDITDAVAKVGVEDSLAERSALAAEKGGKWYAVINNDRCPGYGAVSFAASADSRRYFIGRGPSESAASLEALAKAKAYGGDRPGWETGLVASYFNDTVEVDDRSVGEKVENAVKNWVRGEIVRPTTAPETDFTCWGVRG